MKHLSTPTERIAVFFDLVFLPLCSLIRNYAANRRSHRTAVAIRTAPCYRSASFHRQANPNCPSPSSPSAPLFFFRTFALCNPAPATFPSTGFRAALYEAFSLDGGFSGASCGQRFANTGRIALARGSPEDPHANAHVRPVASSSWRTQLAQSFAR